MVFARASQSRLTARATATTTMARRPMISCCLLQHTGRNVDSSIFSFEKESVIWENSINSQETNASIIANVMWNLRLFEWNRNHHQATKPKRKTIFFCYRLSISSNFSHTIVFTCSELVNQKHGKDISATAALVLTGASLPAPSADGEWKGAASQANILSFPAHLPSQGR